MLKVNSDIAHLFRLLLQIPSYSKVFVPTIGTDPRGGDNFAEPLLQNNCRITGLAQRETSFTYREQAKDSWDKNKANILITAEAEKVKVEEKFHYALAFPPINDDGTFQWKEDTLRQWNVSRYGKNFTAPAHLMMLESMFQSVLPGGYFGAVMPRTWMGSMMRYMKWVNTTIALVARIALPNGVVGRYETLADNEICPVDPLIMYRAKDQYYTYNCSNLSPATRTFDREMKVKGNANRWFLFIWQRPVAEGTSRKNKLFFGTKRYSVFTSKLPSLMEEHTEMVAGQFRRHDWYKMSVQFWNAVLRENLMARYGVSQYDEAEEIKNPAEMRVLRVSDSQRAHFKVCETLQEIEDTPLAVQIKLGPPTKVFPFSLAASAALHDLRTRIGVPSEEAKRRLTDGDKDYHRDGFTIRLKQLSFSENREWLLKSLTDAGLVPCLTRNDFNRLEKQERWLNLQLAPYERVIRVPPQEEGGEETWETIYDDVSVRASFPEVHALWEKRAKSMGLHKSKWSYAFQFGDIVDMACKQSVLNGNHMGLGKTREALFTALLTCTEKVLIVVPTRLVGVWQNEIEETIGNFVRATRKNWQGKRMSADYQIIEWAEQCKPKNLKMFNIISYESLARTPKDAKFFVCPQCKFVVCSVKGNDNQACPKCNHERNKGTKEANRAQGLRKYRLKSVDGEPSVVVDNRLSSGNTVWMQLSEQQFDKVTRKTIETEKKDPITGDPFIEISYKDTPRKPHVGWSFAAALRGRVNTIIIEEANYVNNPKAIRSIALTQLTAGRRQALTGTPVRGYARSICSVLNWTFRREVFPDYRSDSDMLDAGMRKFENKYGTWIEKPEGGTQLIPKINQPEVFQQEIAPLMLRHIRYEPAVAKDIPPRVPIVRTQVIPMDPSHRAYYGLWLEKFSEWWEKKRQEEDGKEGKPSNDLLAKLGYLINASTIPHFMMDGLDDNNEWAKLIQPYNNQKLVAKFLYCQDMIKHNIEQGDKTIVFCWRKANLKLGHAWCKSHKPNPIFSLMVDGTVSNTIDKDSNRSQKQTLVDKFCYQDYHVLWGGIKTMKEGFNIPQANRGIFMDYTWEPTDWQQGLARMLRGNAQKKTVHGTFLCHEGTIEEYIAALVQLKARSEEEGVDHQDFSDFKGEMIPDFRVYANAIVDGNVKAMMTKMWTDVDQLRKEAEEM